jgi:single-strand DNA-binding protein
MNRCEGRGNLAAAPEFKRVEIDGEERAVAELRIYFDRSVPDGGGGFGDRDVSFFNLEVNRSTRKLVVPWSTAEAKMV